MVTSVTIGATAAGVRPYSRAAESNATVSGVAPRRDERGYLGPHLRLLEADRPQLGRDSGIAGRLLVGERLHGVAPALDEWRRPVEGRRAGARARAGNGGGRRPP